MNERKEVRWDRVALVGAILLMAILLVGWIQWNFGISTAAWALGGIFTTALIAGTAIFVQKLNQTSQQNTADLLHEFGAAQTSPYKVIEQQLRADRDRMRHEGKVLQLEAKQADQRNTNDWMADDAHYQPAEEYGPVYVD